VTTRRIRPGAPVRGSTTGLPLMAALDLLGRRWTLRIIWELREAPLGFRLLQERCDGMSSSVLRDRLRELVDVHLVTTDAEGRYALTPTGAALNDALLPMWNWAEAWASEVQTSSEKM